MLPRMSELSQPAAPKSPRRIRWWPAIVVGVLALGAINWVRAHTDWPFQKRNLDTAQVILIALGLWLIWWTIFSRARWRLRLGVLAGFFLCVASVPVLFRIRGVSGDLLPILEFRWARHELPSTIQTNSISTTHRLNVSTNLGFPQFYGPNRDGVLPGLTLDTNWSAHPPQLLWKQEIGAAWSGFAFVGDIAVTQEQRGEDECVVAYEVETGRQLWLHADRTRYFTVIAGEGPRATPTIVGKQVFTCGATGRLNCLDLATGRIVWTRDVVAEGGGKVPGWGCASSPLVLDEMVVVHGGSGKHTLFAFRLADGLPAWTAGTADPSYASPSVATLAGVRQVIGFNHRQTAGYDAATGAILWERPWGNGNPSCSAPVVLGTNQILFSGGYGVGAELFELSPDGAGKINVRQLWRSPRMKAKFAHLYARNGFLYGLDDGVFACVDLADGAQRWKEGRYGHGQGLLVGADYLLMAESGELILLRPTPEAPNELARFRVFNSKTWNPPALAGEFLLVRNDLEAAALRLQLAP